MMNRKSKLLSLLLALCILAAVFPALPSAMAADGETAAPPATAVTYEDVLAGLADPYDYFGPLDENSVPAAVGYENAVERLHVARMYDEEGDSLHNVIFKNADGSRTQYLFDYPVKYVTETGEIADIRLDVVRDAQTAGAFRTAANSVVTTFSPYLSDGILLQSGGVSLRLIPAGASPAPSASSAFSAAPAAQRLDAGTVAYAVDDKTDYEYTLTYTGFKEDIVVSEYTGQTEYTFTLLTNGLTLTQRDGSYYLTDDDGAVKATIGDILIFTADERNNALGTLTHETVQDKQAYTLTIHLDDEYLRDENTAYPIRIDPTIEITSAAGAIEDVTLNSLSGSDGDSWSLTIGKRATYGVSRVLMRFPGLSLSAIPSADKITSASVELRDLMCEDEAMMVYCYVFTGNSWTESTANWSNVNPNSYTTLLSSKTVSYSNGASQPSAHRYAFNITNAVKGWKLGNYMQSKGLLFKAPASVENGSTYIKKTFSSYNRSTYKPSLTVNYDVGESQILANGTYYLNGKEGGGYLRYASGAASAKSGLISSLGNSIRWELQSVDGGYVLRSKSDMTKYLAVPSSTASTSVTVETVSESALPSRCIWTISVASGGCFVKSAYNGKYLYSYGTVLNTSSTTGTSGSAAYNARVWRLASTSYYGNSSTYTNRELSLSSGFSDYVLEVGQSQYIYINKYYNNEIWCDASDFTYSIVPTGKITISSGKINTLKRGTAIITATHKVTDRIKTFEVYVENSLLDENDKTEVYNRFNNLIGDGYAYLPIYNILDVNEALEDVLEHDDIITEYCNEYRIPKEFVQSVLFREIWCYSVTDAAADVAVQEYYAWKEGVGSEPLIKKTDSSTGLGQIFASTAIKALNNADDRNFISLTTQYDASDWYDVWIVWQKLHNNNTFNIQCCSLVILDCQYEFQDDVPYDDFFDFSESQIKTILARYNGYGDAAAEYGDICYQYYQIFEACNS